MRPFLYTVLHNRTQRRRIRSTARIRCASTSFSNYTYDWRHPADDTIGGSSEIFRSNEVQITQLGVGGAFQMDNVRARLLTQFGLYAETTPRNDASPARGQWNLADAYRYVSEAYGGYHFNKLHGINLDAGIFMSYIGLFSCYQFDNWAYQPSFVSSNTPWFFNGVRARFFLTNKLKIEPWLVNGWQSYGRFNTSQKTQAIPTRHGTSPSQATGCPANTSPGPLSTTTAPPTFPTSPARAESRLRAATRALPARLYRGGAGPAQLGEPRHGGHPGEVLNDVRRVTCAARVREPTSASRTPAQPGL